MKIFVSAAEISSDIHAEKILRSLLQALKEEGVSPIQLTGIGGPRLRSIPEFQCLEPAESLRVMGFVEVLGKLKKIKTILNRVLSWIERENPDMILTFDYPDFHLRLMEQVNQRGLASKALKICGIPPKVWVWRSHRIEKIRRIYDGVWVIFPFEKDYYESKSIPVIYEGNPLIANLFSGEQASEVLRRNSDQDEVQVTVMPGSREAEIKYHLPLVHPTLQLLSQKISKRVVALVPIPTGVDSVQIQTQLQPSQTVSYQFVPDGAKACLSSTQVGLIKSGTSTLEAAVLGCVPIIFYKVSKVSELLFRFLVGYLGPVGLPNILLGIKDRKKAIFPEFLGPEATPEALSNAMALVIQDQKEWKNRVGQGVQLRAALVPSSDLNRLIAKKIYEWYRHRPIRSQNFSRSMIWIRCGSFLWSSLNWFRRRLMLGGVLPSLKVQTPSVLVGNLQVGGAGKTPMVIELAKEGLRRGKSVAVISRGYGVELGGAVRVIDSGIKTTAREVGDEPAEIKLAVPEVVLGVGADRRAVLAKIPKVDLIVFDDGFQNLKFSPSVVVLAETRKARSEILYRDFESEAQFADVRVEKESLQWKVDDLPQLPVWLMSGVADSDSIVRFYGSLGLIIENVISKPDHAHFSLEEVKNLMLQASKKSAILVVTQKDFVKLSDLGVECYSEPLKSVHVPDANKVGVLTREMLTKEWVQIAFERLHLN